METGESNLKVVRETTRNNFQLIPKSFNQELAAVCLLAFVVDGNALKFSLVNKSKARYEGFGSYKFKSETLSATELRRFLKGEPIFRNDFAQVIYVERNRNFSSIPTPFYNPNNQREYLQKSSYWKESFKNLSNSNKTFQVTNAAQFNFELKKEIFEFFAKGNTFHHQDVLLEMAAMLQNIEATPKAILNIEGAFFDLVIANQKELLLSNSFYFEAPEDILYYMLLAFDKLQLNESDIQINIIGEKCQGSSFQVLLNKYLTNWKYLDDSPFLESSDTLSEIQLSNYFLTLNSFLCA